MIPSVVYPGPARRSFSLSFAAAMHPLSCATSATSLSSPTSSNLSSSSSAAATASSSLSPGCPAPSGPSAERNLFSALWEEADRYLVQRLADAPQQLLCGMRILQHYECLRVEELAYILGFCFRSSADVLLCFSLFLPDSLLLLQPNSNNAAPLCDLIQQLAPEKYYVFSRLLQQITVQQQQHKRKTGREVQRQHQQLQRRAGNELPQREQQDQQKAARELLLHQLQVLFHDSPLITRGLRKLLLQRCYLERSFNNSSEAAALPELPVEILRPREDEPLQLHAVYRLAEQVAASSSSSGWRSGSSFGSEVLHVARMHLGGRVSFSFFSQEVDRLWCGFPLWRKHALAIKQLVAALRRSDYVASHQTAALAQSVLHRHPGAPEETTSLSPRDACGLFLEALASNSPALRLEFDHLISSSNASRQQLSSSASSSSSSSASPYAAAAVPGAGVATPAVMTLQRLASVLMQEQQHASCERLGVLLRFFLDKEQKEQATAAAARKSAVAAAPGSVASNVPIPPATAATPAPASRAAVAAAGASAAAFSLAVLAAAATTKVPAAASASSAAALPFHAAAAARSTAAAAELSFAATGAGGGEEVARDAPSTTRKRARTVYEQQIHALLQTTSASLPQAQETATRAREAAAVAAGFAAASAASRGSASASLRAAGVVAAAEAIAPHVVPARCRSQQQLLDLVGPRWLPLVYTILDEWNAGLFTKQQAIEALTCIAGTDSRAKSALRPIVSLLESRKLGRQRQATAALCRQHFHSWERKGASYRRLPPEWPPAASSGRDALCCSVLNDRWASVSDNSESQARATNFHEEQLLRLEDVRYLWDVRIGRLQSLLLLIENIVRQLAAVPLHRRRFASIKPSAFTSLHADALRLVFGTNATAQVLSHVCVSPLTSLPVVHNTLLLKLQQWKAVRQLLDVEWRQQEAPHWAAALDYRKKLRKASQSESEDACAHTAAASRASASQATSSSSKLANSK